MKKVFCVFKIDYVVVESVAVDSPVAHTVAISVDSVDRIMQNLRYLCALVNTQSDEGIDSQFRIERFVRLQDDSLFRNKERVDIVYKIRENVEDGLVDKLVELLVVFFGESSRTHQLQKVVGLLCVDFSDHKFRQLVEP